MPTDRQARRSRATPHSRLLPNLTYPKQPQLAQPTPEATPTCPFSPGNILTTQPPPHFPAGHKSPATATPPLQPIPCPPQLSPRAAAHRRGSLGHIPPATTSAAAISTSPPRPTPRRLPSPSAAISHQHHPAATHPGHSHPSRAAASVPASTPHATATPALRIPPATPTLTHPATCSPLPPPLPTYPGRAPPPTLTSPAHPQLAETATPPKLLPPATGIKF